MATTDHDVKHLNNKLENKLTMTYELTLQAWLIDVQLSAQQMWSRFNDQVSDAIIQSS